MFSGIAPLSATSTKDSPIMGALTARASELGCPVPRGGRVAHQMSDHAAVLAAPPSTCREQEAHSSSQCATGVASSRDRRPPMYVPRAPRGGPPHPNVRPQAPLCSASARYVPRAPRALGSSGATASRRYAVARRRCTQPAPPKRPSSFQCATASRHVRWRVADVRAARAAARVWLVPMYAPGPPMCTRARRCMRTHHQHDGVLVRGRSAGSSRACFYDVQAARRAALRDRRARARHRCNLDVATVIALVA
jgi:hypothetical protein